MKPLGIVIQFIVLGMLLFVAVPALASVDSLIAGTSIVIEGKPGNFDFMASDPLAGRILAAHKGAGSLAILDLTTQKSLASVSVGDAQGLAIDVKGRKYFIGNDVAKSIVIVDANSNKQIATIKVTGPVDAMVFVPSNGMLYAAEDDGDRLWVIDPANAKVFTEIKIPGKPEGIEFDAKTNRIFLNLKNTNSIVRIDPIANKIDANWSTLPATSPHGLTLDSAHELAYVGGRNGKLVAISLKSGTIVSTVDIAEGNDQLAYDFESGLIYSAGKAMMSVTKIRNSKMESIVQVAMPKGTHSITLDPKKHSVWVAYTDESHSYFREYSVDSKSTPQYRQRK